MNVKKEKNVLMHVSITKILKQRITEYAEKNSLSVSSAVCILCSKSLEMDNALNILNGVLSNNELKKEFKKEISKNSKN